MTESLHHCGTVQLLKQMTPDFIPPTLWPPNNSDLNPVDYAVWGIMQERVYKKIKDVGELRQQIVQKWNGKNSASMWLTMRSDSGAGDCEAVSMQMVDSLNILCDWHSEYHNGRHCRFLSVWLYCIDSIATCSALYSQELIRLFIAKNIYYIFHKVQRQ